VSGLPSLKESLNLGTTKFKWITNLKLKTTNVVAIAEPGIPILPPYQYQLAESSEPACRLRIMIYGFMLSSQELVCDSAQPRNENLAEAGEGEKCVCWGPWTFVFVD